MVALIEGVAGLVLLLTFLTWITGHMRLGQAIVNVLFVLLVSWGLTACATAVGL